MASFHFFESLPSTMDEARARALQGAEEGSVIVAYQQSKGRGRRGRVWESLRGNLYFTYITYLSCSPLEAPQLSFVACVAVGEGLRSLMPPGHLLRYKWPNDLLLNGKKAAGLLLESMAIPESNKTGYLIGCGLNLIAYPLTARYPTTSFQNEGIYLSLEAVLQRVVSSLQRTLALWRKEGFSPIYELWMQDVAGLETKITFDLQGLSQEGIFKGIDKEGALILKTSQGLKKFKAGEIL
jgi:BirA family biotin operon repressor/biotin-[acetyl-CoA-carboxylase] ligase